MMSQPMMSKTDKHRRSSDSSLRSSRSHSKSSERGKSPKGRRKGVSGNTGCHLFGGGGTADSSTESSRESSPLPTTRRHLSSLEKQISDKKRYCGSKETVFHNPDYIKLKLGKYASLLVMRAYIIT